MSGHPINQQGFLQTFAKSAFFRAVAHLLIALHVYWGLTIQAHAANVGDGTLPTAELSSPFYSDLSQVLSIGNYKQTAVTRITRTQFDFTYTASVNNSSANTYHKVKATLTSRNPATVITDGSLTFNTTLDPFQNVASQDSFTIRQDRSIPFNPNDLVWTFQSNQAPVANAGPDATVALGAEVELNATASTDADSNPISYRWSLIERPTASNAILDNPTLPKPHFTADRAGQYLWQLIVNDDFQDSAADTVIITTGNSKPIADAGPDQTVATGDIVYLDGTASRDPDSDELQFSWTLTEKPTDSNTRLSLDDTANPHFTADKPGRYQLHLTVSDGQFSSDADLLVVSTRNSAPVADAGPDQSITLGDPALTLNGKASHDADGQPLTFQWSILSAPSDSIARITPTNSAEASFNPDLAGLYIAQLIVNDGELDSQPDTLTIEVKPQANRKPNITSSPLTVGRTGVPYRYDVDAQDPDTNDTLTFSLTGAPSSMSIDSSSGLILWLPAATGSYAVSVQVKDKAGSADSQTYNLIVTANHAPQITSSPVTQATVANRYSYPVTATDSDNDALTYSLTQQPEGMSISAQTGLIEWLPAVNQIGEQTVTVSVSDNGGLIDTQNFSIKVISNNRAPSAQDANFTSQPQQILLDFEDGQLPSQKGWSYGSDCSQLVAGGVDLAENDAATISGGMLNLDTTGPSANGVVGYYALNNIIDPKKDLYFEARLRVKTLEAAPPDRTQAFALAVLTDQSLYIAEVGDNEIHSHIPQQNGQSAPVDVSQFHSYTLIKPAGSASYKIQVDGQTLITQDAYSGYPAAFNQLYFGDGTCLARNGSVEIDYVRVEQKSPNNSIISPEPGVLSGASDPDGDPLTAVLVEQPAHGTLTLNANGSFTYVPNAGFVGTDSFSYAASDGKLESAPSTVIILIGDNNLPPIVTSTPNTSRWMELNPTGTLPNPKYAGSVQSYDEANDRLIVFGGQDASNKQLNDVWVLSHASGLGGTPEWEKLQPTGTLPSPRALFISAYDATANRLIVYGGCSGGCSPTGDAWVLTHANGLGGQPEWLPLPASNSLGFGAGGYDAINNRLIVFGGLPDGKGSDTTDVKVLLDANGVGEPRWLSLNPAGTPPPVRGHSQPGVYDPLSNTLMVFGGQSSAGASANYNDIWILNHANGLGGMPTWTQLSPSGSAPIPRAHHTLAFDANSNHLIVFGGYDGDTNSRLNDSWVLTHANGQGGTPEWLKLPITELPKVASGPTAGYSRQSNRLIAAVGVGMDETVLNETWVLTNASGNCTAGQACDYDVDASDPDAGDTLTYALVSGPAGMSIDASSGQLHWVPAANQVGTHDVTVKVSDAGGLSATQSFQLTVAPVAVPNVQGLAPEWAEAMLQAAGLSTGAKSSLGGAVTLNFDTLPTEQGWEYFAFNNSVLENQIFTLNNGVLKQNSLGAGFQGQGSNRYNLSNVLGVRLPNHTFVTAKVLQEEGDNSNPCGFEYGVFTGIETSGICLGTSILQDQRGKTGPTLTNDNTYFQEFTLSSTPGNGFILLSDGNKVHSGPNVISNFNNQLFIGDATGGSNAKAEIAAYSFTQPQIKTQTPAPGTLVKPASTVDLGIQDGPATQTVPDVVAQAQAVAQNAIATAGLLVGTLTTQASNTVPAGEVIKQKPVAGTHIMKDFKVDLVVSSGPIIGGACVAPPVGMVAWWSGDATAQDYVSADHGILQNGVGYEIGLVGSAFSFDGNDDWMDVPDSANQTPKSLSVEAWVNPKVLDGVRPILAKYNSSAFGGGVSWAFHVHRDPRSSLRFCVYGNKTGSIARCFNTDAQPLVAEEWSHVAATFDVGTQEIKVFVNGHLETGTLDENSVITGIFDSTSPVQIGTYVNALGQKEGLWQGLIDEATLYNRALTQSEIQAIYNAGSYGKCKTGIVVADAGPDSGGTTGDLVTLNGAASRDLSGKPISYAWTLIEKPDGSFTELENPATVNPSFVPDVAGDYLLRLTVNNGSKTSAPDTVKITVSGESQNRPPVISSVAITTASTEQAYSYDVQASDPDTGDVLTYSLTTAPTGMSIDSASGLIQWTPTVAQVGSQTVTVKVQDKGGLSDSQSFSVLVSLINRAPIITSTPPASVKANKLYSYVIVASDPDQGDKLSYSFATNTPPGMTIDVDTGLLQWTPAATLVGVHHGISVKVTDKAGLSASQTFDITVLPANRAPVINSSAPTVATENIAYSYAVQASDPDVGDTFSFALSAAPAGMTIDANGQIAWTPSSAQIGVHAVTLEVKDQDGLAGTQSFNLKVEAASVAVPSLTGQTVAQAQAALTAAQLKLGSQTTAYDEGVPVNRIISQQPPAGMAVAKQSAVDVVISLGPAPVNVPSVVGLTEAAAEAALIAGKLTVGGKTSQYSDTVPIGNVISQNPSAGASASKATPVDLLISSGPAPVNVPGVVGLSEAAATSAIVAAKLVVGLKTTQAHDIVPAGNVISQNPPANAVVAKGSAVDLLISSGPAAHPLASLLIQPGNPLLLTGDNLTLSALGILDDGSSQTLSGGSWSSSAPAVASVDNTGAIQALSEGQTVITVQKGSISATLTVTVKAAVPDDTTFPEAAISAPIMDAVITAPTDIIGTASDANFLKYELSLSPLGENNFTVFKTGSTAVSNGVLGTLDPTLLLNDQYILRLQAWDRHNNPSGKVDVRVQIAREQKVGNFTLAFQDVNVPMACMPLSVTRVYDSRDKKKGDFGVGWRLDVKTLQLRESREMGSGWHVDLINKKQGFITIPTYVLSADDSHKVSLTLPDGQVEEFDMNVGPAESQFFPIGTVNVSYAPRPGTLGSLAPVGPTSWDLSGETGTVELIDSEVNLFNPQQYRYTAPDGSTYLIDKSSGVQNVQCANGQSLSFGPNGISHSDGVGVSFTRDGQNRITAISDPNGNSQTYSYNAAGDLVQHNDPTHQNTAFNYDYRHGLLDVIDPRGVTAVRNEYDADGRLIGNTDAAGKKIVYNHDLVNKTETITDRLGNVTVYDYDDKGNVIHQVDALGNETVFTYDSVGNQLSKTDALGRTTSQEYDTRRNVLNETDPLGNVTRYTYHALNGVKTITDALGRVTSNDYDANGNLLSSTDSLGAVTNYGYDKGGIIYAGSGLMTSKTDALGNVTRYNYDAQGRLTQETDAKNNVTTYQYDANGNRIEEKRSRTVLDVGVETLTTSFEYDALNRLVKTTHPDGSVSRTVYNAIGKQAQTIDAAGKVTSYEYDDLGHLVKTTYPDGASESSQYDAEGRRIASTDRAGRNTAYTYDALGRLVQTTYSDGTTSSTTYDAVGQVVASTDAEGHVTQYQYDAAGRRSKVIDALGHETVFSYDAAGNQIRITDANGHVTQFVYDNANRRIQVKYPDGTTDQTGYDTLGRNISKTDQADITTQFAYDVLGRLIKVTDALGQITTYGYDELGNQLSQTDANGHTTLFAYDEMGRRVSRTLPDGQTETMVYDNSGNLLSKTDFNGRTTTFEYDESNRLSQKAPDAALNEPAVQFSYTVSGQRASMQDASGLTTYSYDARDRLTEKATPQGSLSYSYNGAGLLAGIQSERADGVHLQYQYDALNRLASVTDVNLGASQTLYSYDNVGNLQSYDYANGVSHQYSYNNLNRLQNLQVGKGATALASYAYTLGPSGNRLSVAELSGRTLNYSYDALYRLTQESISGAASHNGQIAYTYDPVGNRLNRTSTVASVTNQVFSYNANDQLASDQYDANGNTTGSDGQSYQYDSDNRLTDMNGGTVKVVYDGDGNRVSKTVAGVTTQYLVDSLNPTGYAQVLEERSNGQVTVVYGYGLDLISQNRKGLNGWKASYYGYDGHGSVRFLTDASGNITDTYDYDAFGILLGHTGNTVNSYLYSGEQLDKHIALYNFRARYMNPISGRFFSKDSFEGFTTTPLSLHKYLYAYGDPSNKFDPSGNITLTELELATAISGILHTYELAKGGIKAWQVAIKLVSKGYYSFFLSKELHYHRNELFSRTKPPEYESMLNAAFWIPTNPINSPVHNIRSNGRNRDYRGRGIFKGEQAIYDSNGVLVTTSEDGGTFDFYPPPESGANWLDAFWSYPRHFFWDVVPWIHWGNSAEDTTTREERLEKAKEIPELWWTIVPLGLHLPGN